MSEGSFINYFFFYKSNGESHILCQHTCFGKKKTLPSALKMFPLISAKGGSISWNYLKRGSCVMYGTVVMGQRFQLGVGSMWHNLLQYNNFIFASIFILPLYNFESGYHLIFWHWSAEEKTLWKHLYKLKKIYKFFTQTRQWKHYFITEWNDNSDFKILALAIMTTKSDHSSIMPPSWGTAMNSVSKEGFFVRFLRAERIYVFHLKIQKVSFLFATVTTCEGLFSVFCSFHNQKTIIMFTYSVLQSSLCTSNVETFTKRVKQH